MLRETLGTILIGKRKALTPVIYRRFRKDIKQGQSQGLWKFAVEGRGKDGR
jgi:hypothetical protein